MPAAVYLAEPGGGIVGCGARSFAVVVHVHQHAAIVEEAGHFEIYGVAGVFHLRPVVRAGVAGEGAEYRVLVGIVDTILVPLVVVADYLRHGHGHATYQGTVVLGGNGRIGGAQDVIWPSLVPGGFHQRLDGPSACFQVRRHPGGGISRYPCSVGHGIGHAYEKACRIHIKRKLLVE